MTISAASIIRLFMSRISMYEVNVVRVHPETAIRPLIAKKSERQSDFQDS